MFPALTPKNSAAGRTRHGSARPPVGLAEDADAEARRLEHPAEQRHREARVIDVGVAGDEDDVAAIPAARVHLGARRRAMTGAMPNRSAQYFRRENNVFGTSSGEIGTKPADLRAKLMTRP